MRHLSFAERIAFNRLGRLFGLMLVAQFEPNPNATLRRLIREERLNMRSSLKLIRRYLKSGNLIDLYNDDTEGTFIFRTSVGFGDKFAGL